MNAFEVASHVGRCLDEDGLPYAIGGAMALTAWAIPRDTKDVDLSVFVGEDQVETVFDSLERAGVMIDRGDARRSVSRIGLFAGRCGRTLVDVFLGAHPHFEAMARRRVRIPLPRGPELWFLSAEDLCIMKLFYGRAKDVSDLERLFAAIPTLDVDYIRTWLAQMVLKGDRRLDMLDALVQRFRGP